MLNECVCMCMHSMDTARLPVFQREQENYVCMLVRLDLFGYAIAVCNKEITDGCTMHVNYS